MRIGRMARRCGSSTELGSAPRRLRSRGATRSAQALAEEMAASAEALRIEREALIGQRERQVIEIGDRVRIPRYDVVGEVVSMSRADDTCAVQAGQVRITCKVSELDLVERAADRKQPPAGAVETTSSPDDDGAPQPSRSIERQTAEESAIPLRRAHRESYHTGGRD